MTIEPKCADCRFCEPYDSFVKTPMCAARVPRHFTEFARLPTGDCKPEGLLYEARK
jgi:hypothetical protein